MRVLTGASSTLLARTNAVAPFGFTGICTRYQAGEQSRRTTAPSTPKTVG
jgi:hypothetical protein